MSRSLFDQFMFFKQTAGLFYEARFNSSFPFFSKPSSYFSRRHSKTAHSASPISRRNNSTKSLHPIYGYNQTPSTSYNGRFFSKFMHNLLRKTLGGMDRLWPFIPLLGLLQHYPQLRTGAEMSYMQNRYYILWRNFPS